MFCVHCGAPLAEGTQFCTTCGRDQASPVGPPAIVTPSVFVPPANVRARSMDWMSAGWEVVKEDLGNFALVSLVSVVLNSVVPFILGGPLNAGTFIFTENKLRKRRSDLNDLFKGFNYFVPSMVASLLISLFVMIGMALCIIPGLVVMAMYTFTYLFIVDKKMDFWPAMEASHAVVKNDYFGFTIFVLLMGLLNIVGLLCCVVGLLVTIPITHAAVTIAYRDIVGFEPNTEL
jgi:membrane protein YqaA with SNARE-associated domain